MYNHPIKNKKRNPYHDKKGKVVNLFSYWGYVKVGIEGTQIELGEDTVSDATQSDDEEFLNFVDKL